MPKLNLQFENVFKIATMSMRINCSHPALTRNKLWIIQFTTIMTLIFSSAFFLSHSFFVYDIPTRNYAEASKNGSMILVCCMVTFKYLILLYNQKSVKTYIEVIDADYKLAKRFSKDERDIVCRYSQKGVKVCRLLLLSAAVTSAFFPLKAFALMLYYYWQGEFKLVPMFNLTCPQFIEPYKFYLPVFFALSLMSLVFDGLTATMYIGFNALVPIFMLHTCGQLELISQRIIKLFSEVDDPRIIEKKLKNIISKYQQLSRFVEQVRNNFTLLNELSMKATTVVLPLIAFQIVEDLRCGRLNIEFTSLFAGSLLLFFMPCYYSDLLMEKSESFRQAIYSCGWEKVPDKRVRKMILFMMTRATVPLGISTIFYPLCLDTFAVMCRQSYAIFNLMNAMWG